VGGVGEDQSGLGWRPGEVSDGVATGGDRLAIHRLVQRLLQVRWRWLSVFVVAAPMLIIGGVLGNRDLLFPEGAALAFGVLSLRLPEWRRSAAVLAVLPAACAALGVALVHAAVPRWVGEIAALTGAFVLLAVLRSRLTPSISAAVFPLVFDVGLGVSPRCGGHRHDARRGRPLG